MMTEEIQYAQKDEMPIENRTYKNESVVNMDIQKLDFVAVHFYACRFENCDFTGCSFFSGKFEQCDFSNCIFDNSYWKESEIIYCKGDGSRFCHAVLKKTMLRDSQLNLANFSGSVWDGCRAETVSFREAFFSEVKLKKTIVFKSDFTKVDFFRTPLKGIDFSDSTIENLLVSEGCQEVSGMKINMFQAAEIAKLLGVKIV
jgi:uncharacterized protein YjbI with pentapeptide repeats